ncbi:MAG TPA: PQQ-binding-like beta-propeller repeat protein [Kribbella sp.]
MKCLVAGARPVRRRLLCTVWVLAAASACSGGIGGDAPPSGRGTPAVAPITVDEAPLWRTPGNLGPYERVTVHGDSLLINGSTEDAQAQRLVAFDLETGSVRWRVDSRTRLPGDDRARLDEPRDNPAPLVAGGDEAWTVLVPFSHWCHPYADGCAGDPADETGFGVAALSGTDGTVRWKAPMVPTNAGSGPAHQLLAADENIAVSVVVVGCCEVGDLAKVRIVATNVSDGSQAWESGGSWPQFVAGGSVLGVTSGRMPVPGSGADYLRDGSTVVALDAKTGAKKWDLADRYESATVVSALGDVAVIETLDEDRRTFRSFAIDADTGKEIAELGASEDGLPCEGDEDTLIVCRQHGRGDLVTFDIDRRRVSAGESVPALGGAWHGYVLAGYRITDRKGTTVAEFPPYVTVLAMSQNHVILYDGNRQEYTVRRITR